MIFFKENPFFLNFEITILAFGNYLSKSKIEKNFNVKHKKGMSEKYRKLEIYTNNEQTKLVVNTRQLSSGVADVYLEKLGNVMNN